MRKLLLTTTAARDLQWLPVDVRAIMVASIEACAAGEIVDAATMRNRDGDIVRLRAGEYRAIVTVTRAAAIVRRVRHRSIVYRP